MTGILTEEQELIQKTARDFSRDRLAPGAAAREAAGCIEPDVINEMGKLGFLGMTVPENQGGIGTDYVSYALALMEMAAGDGAVSTMMSVHNAPFCAILSRFASPEQQQRWLTPAAEGAFIGAFALTEPHTGSDAAAIKCSAQRSASGYVLNGSKQFITSARIAGGIVAFAVTDKDAGKKGISAFYIEPGGQGFTVGAPEHKLGQKASDTCTLTFDSLEVEPSHLIGEEGQGLAIALSSLETGRIGIAAQSVGMAQAALDVAVVYAQDRVTFGKPIAQHQAVAFRLADMDMQVEAARQLVLNAARLKDSGAPCLREASIAKLFASQMAERVVSDAIQTLGGYGYLADFPLERIYRDVRVCQIYEGTSDVQRINISRELLGGRAR
ncbi:acyl-CoA dehydrogenase (plasmid) [Sulfitobacter sp. SK012]|uniref:acyl-CoA dehydrogenase family protein n=1 Tax=Sulfitobacter sp. SK012 TaxID=1389005 RepID=UPI000E0AA989|nr:acyl-CoA dehydrogenase family protein [Sulfitobacter sp. SK012]AXI49240.1 acyl-CoA dehydrogenase [Sulfitobacter sp. SK012]|tara:strand:+ start:4619 stop:5770 length:1152 start_codon:yes stop_codon:yes gene_type:complete